MKKLYRSVIPALLFAGLASCSLDEPNAGRQEYGLAPLAINANICGTTPTRAIINPKDTSDEWSYIGFQYDDRMGFFSSGGNFTDGNNGDAPFVNQELVYIGGEGGDNFRDPNDTQFSPTHMKGNEIFMYFPYTPDITSDKGVELRTNYWPDGLPLDTARCIDFLSTDYLSIYSENTSSKAALYGEFKHTFAELIIMRGEGFDQPKYIDGKKEWEIKVVLDKPITGLKVETAGEGESWKATPTFVYDESMESSEAQTWRAWLGGNFYLTEQDDIGQNAWYVIVPTIGCQADIGEKRPGVRSIVQYVELYDNDGNLQRVSSLRLSNSNSKYVDGGWRYPMQISMRELVPTANPCAILPWKSDVDLTDARVRGINNLADFERWRSAYNAYLGDKDNTLNKEALLQYGDLYTNPDGTVYWHFYVLADLDLSTASTDGTNPLVPTLEDILDGQSTDFTNGRFLNHNVSGLNVPLAGTMKGQNAQIQNFNFVSPNVRFDNTASAPAGIIANIMEDGSSVTNCVIRQGTMYHPGGPAGMIVGSIAASCSIEDCTVSGYLISSANKDALAGEAPDGIYNSKNNNSANVTEFTNR